MTLSVHGEAKTRYVHRLVCEAYYGPSPAGDYQCRHMDGTRDNNRPDNLCWSTRKENESDKDRHGTRRWGDMMGDQNVLDANTVMEARRRCAAGEQIKDVAKEIGISDRVLADAVTGRRWGRLPGAIVPYSTKRKLTDGQVQEIRRRHGAGETQEALATEFGVARSAIWQCVKHRTYTHVPAEALEYDDLAEAKRKQG